MEFKMTIDENGILKELELNGKVYREVWEMDSPGHMSCLTDIIGEQLYDDNYDELADRLDDLDEMGILRYAIYED